MSGLRLLPGLGLSWAVGLFVLPTLAGSAQALPQLTALPPRAPRPPAGEFPLHAEA